MQVAQLLFRHRCWRIDEQVLSALCLRERDHIADRFCAAHQHDHAVEAEGDSTVRRRTELQRIEQEPELLLLVVRRNPERCEDFRLDFRTMDRTDPPPISDPFSTTS